MKYKLLEKKNEIKSIRKIDRYIKIRKFHYVSISKNNVQIFESNCENMFADIASIKKDKIVVLNYPKIQIYNLETRNILQEITIEVEGQCGTCKIHEDKIFLVEKENPDDLATIYCKTLETLKPIWSVDEVSIRIFHIYFTNDLFFFTDAKMQILQTLDVFSGLKKWHFDISQFGTYADKKYINEEPIICQREINRVYYYHNKIIVTLSRTIIALNPDNGELLWKIDFEKYDPVTLVFNENIAYSGRLIYFATIDIEKGIKLFERNFDPAFRLNIEGFILSQIRYINMTLFQNHLWFTHEENSRQFLLKANPENGDIVDGMLLETQHSTDAPIFDENRMYILDQEGYLYVYEEVK